MQLPVEGDLSTGRGSDSAIPFCQSFLANVSRPVQMRVPWARCFLTWKQRAPVLGDWGVSGEADALS